MYTKEEKEAMKPLVDAADDVLAVVALICAKGATVPQEWISRTIEKMSWIYAGARTPAQRLFLVDKHIHAMPEPFRCTDPLDEQECRSILAHGIEA